jgi:hypothetical protein
MLTLIRLLASISFSTLLDNPDSKMHSKVLLSEDVRCKPLINYISKLIERNLTAKRRLHLATTRIFVCRIAQ